MKKKILVDTISLLSPFTGIARYTYENTSRIIKQDTSNNSYFFNYATHHSATLSSKATQSKLKSIIVKMPLLKKVLRKLISIYTKLYTPSYDLYWQPNFIPEPNIKAKVVVATVHDFSFYLQPNWHPKERLEHFNKYFWKLLPKVDHIITGSDFSKQEIIKYLDYDSNRITVIPHALDHNLYKEYTKEQLLPTKQKLDLPDNFILFVGSIEPRKNLLTLLKAYSNLPTYIKETYPLLLVGFKGWENKEIFSIIQKQKDYIKYLGYIDDEDLAHIYALATIFVFPTHYEGFGIPPIEAFACATPTIVSKVASLPQVCQDATLYIDPLNQDDITQKILMLLQSPKLQQELIEKGLKKAQQYSWDKAAKMHLGLFQKLLSST